LADLAAQRGKIQNPSVVYIGTELPNSSVREMPQGRDIVLLTSGQKHKRNDMAVEIFKRTQDASLVFIGNAQAILNSLSTENRAWVSGSDRVNFTGYLTRDELYARLQAAWCLLTCSELESFYMVAVEAMAVGCPVLVADKTSARESIGDAGLLFKNETDAAAQLSKLSEPKVWEEMSKRGKIWSQQFDATLCTNDFVRKCDEALGR
jgi:glycosyltransferase involved in cell wall biosynthesis